MITPRPGVTPLTSTVGFGVYQGVPSVHASIEFVNNTSSWQDLSGYTLRTFDATGTQLSTGGASWADQRVLAPGMVARLDMDWTLVDPGTTRISIVPVVSPLPDHGSNGLSIAIKPSSTYGQQTDYDFDATLTNASAHARRTSYYVSAYNSMGVITLAAEGFEVLPPKGVRHFQLYRQSVFPNRVISTVAASWSSPRSDHQTRYRATASGAIRVSYRMRDFAKPKRREAFIETQWRRGTFYRRHPLTDNFCISEHIAGTLPKGRSFADASLLGTVAYSWR